MVEAISEVIKAVHTEDAGGLEGDNGSLWSLLKLPGHPLDQSQEMSKKEWSRRNLRFPAWVDANAPGQTKDIKMDTETKSPISEVWSVNE